MDNSPLTTAARKAHAAIYQLLDADGDMNAVDFNQLHWALNSLTNALAHQPLRWVRFDLCANSTNYELRWGKQRIGMAYNYDVIPRPANMHELPGGWSCDLPGVHRTGSLKNIDEAKQQLWGAAMDWINATTTTD